MFRIIAMIICLAFLYACGNNAVQTEAKRSATTTQLCDCYTRNRTTVESSGNVLNACLDSFGLRTVQGNDTAALQRDANRIFASLLDSCTVIVADLSKLRDQIMLNEDTANVAQRLDQISKQLRNQPSDSLRYERADLWIKLQQFDSAKADLNRIGTDYKKGEVLFCRIYCHEKLGDFDSAATDCATYQKLKPNEAYFLKGLLKYAVAQSQK